MKPNQSGQTLSKMIQGRREGKCCLQANPIMPRGREPFDEACTHWEKGIEFAVEMMTSGVAKFEGRNANEPGLQHLFLPNPPNQMWGKEKKESELINHRNARWTLLCELRGLF